MPIFGAAASRRTSVCRGIRRRVWGTRCAIRGTISSDVVRRIKDANLWIVTAGTPNSAPHELLSSQRFDTLLQDARRDFSCVLIDTPPCVLMPDCRVIERLVDGFLLVIAAHKTPRKLVAEALHELDRTKMLGVVFNADDLAGSRYYGYYGGYYEAPSARSRRAAWWKRLRGAR